MIGNNKLNISGFKGHYPEIVVKKFGEDPVCLIPSPRRLCLKVYNFQGLMGVPLG